MSSLVLQALGFDLRSSSFLSFLPWLVMATGSSAAGLLADSLVSRGVDVTSVRKALQTVAFLVPAVALLVLAQPGLSPAQAVAAMTVALGTTSLGQVSEAGALHPVRSCRGATMLTYPSLTHLPGGVCCEYVGHCPKACWQDVRAVQHIRMPEW